MSNTGWTLDDYAKHYAKTLNQQPNGWGQYVSELFGQSHHIMIAACKHFPKDEVTAAFHKAIEDYKEGGEDDE